MRRAGTGERGAQRREILIAARRSYRGDLPERYWDHPASFRAPFDELVNERLRTDQLVLDVGGGRSPTVPPRARPPGSRYVGLDVSLAELERAPSGAYDELIVGDISDERPDLKERFDLVVSFQALEHVRQLERAFDNIFRYLRPGGQLVAQLSATFSVYGLLNRVTPHSVNRRLQHRLYGRPPDTVCRAHYDHCYFDALHRMMGPWSKVEVRPLWIAEPYFHFSRMFRSAYIAYEEWTRTSNRTNLAPYYLITATR